MNEYIIINNEIKPTSVYIPSDGPQFREFDIKNCVQSSFNKNDKVIKDTHDNSFVSSIVTAYNNHHNIEIRPDDVWLAILTQFSSYVNGNSEKLRNSFVNFGDKKQLVVVGGGNLFTADYPTLSAKLCDQMQGFLVDDEIREWCMPNFTTTTQSDKTVASFVMMATMQKYFDYKMMLMCGIPKIAILGTSKDWIDIRQRIQKLRQYDIGESKIMNEWADVLSVIVGEIIDVFVDVPTVGDVNYKFWKGICHRTGGSGSNYLLGWITAFTVFDAKGRWQVEKSTYPDWPYYELDISDIASGFVNVPIVIDDNGHTHNVRVFAGHMLADVEDKYTLVPRLDWIMVKENTLSF